jgi:16S rRNA (cytidine1402-2'-O)-methyltransferase
MNFLTAGKSAVLISDCGTPLFSDPGHILLDMCISNDIKIEVVPGVNSLIPAITGSGMRIEKFYYFGWLSPKKNIRRMELTKLRSLREVIALMETPYRLRTVLNDVNKLFGNNVRAVLAFELTSKNEKYFRGTINEIKAEADRRQLKGEFVLLIDNRRKQH